MPRHKGLLGGLDLPPVVPSAAFFDLDKTVIAKSSALAFGRPFYRDGLITRRDVVKSAYAQLMFRLGGADEQQMARIRDHIAQLCRGWRVDQVRQIVNETLHELINPYVYAEAAALIDEHRAAGRDIVVVSTSGEEMVRPIAEQLGVTDVIATRMVVEDGRYTGEVAYYAAGPTKAEAARKLAEDRDYDLSSSYAYSDSISDVPLLETVGHPTAVNPDRALRRTAAERGWQVLEFRHPVPLLRRLRDRPAVPVAAAAIGLGVGVAIGLALYGRHRRARTAAVGPRPTGPTATLNHTRRDPSQNRTWGWRNRAKRRTKRGADFDPVAAVGYPDVLRTRPPGTHARPAAGRHVALDPRGPLTTKVRCTLGNPAGRVLTAPPHVGRRPRVRAAGRLPFVAQPAWHAPRMTIIGLVGAGHMGSGLGAALRDGGHEVVTTLAGRSARTAAWWPASGSPARSQRRRLRGGVLFVVTPPGSAVDAAMAIAAASDATGARPLVADLNAVSPSTMER